MLTPFPRPSSRNAQYKLRLERPEDHESHSQAKQHSGDEDARDKPRSKRGKSPESRDPPIQPEFDVNTEDGVWLTYSDVSLEGGKFNRKNM